MELKFASELRNNKFNNCFNRTFMELKLLEYTKTLSAKILVLIVPLWN